MGTREGTPRRAILFLAGAFMCLGLQGCLVSYRDYPKHYVDTPLAKQQVQDAVLRFKIQGSTIGGGKAAVERTILEEAPYQRVVYSEQIPEQGDFLLVRMVNSSPTFPAFVFGYLSASTLLIVPAWSTTTGADMYFDYYRDGESQRTFSGCEVRRNVFVWLGLAPLAWINLLTNGEQDVYRACTRQLLETALPLAASNNNG